MSFDSQEQVVIAAPAPQVYYTLSCQDNFTRVMHLSPTCHSVQVLRNDLVEVNIAADAAERDLADLADNQLTYRPINGQQSPASGELCTRIHFQMIERIPLLFGLFHNDVTIFGTQIMSQKLRLHIYESSANKGLVQIYKLRRILNEDQQKSRVEELISGKTSKLLQSYTQAACRKAHRAHMQSYKLLMQQAASAEIQK